MNKHVKPQLTVVAGRPVTIPANGVKRPSPLEIARARFGRPFAHELVNDFTPHPRGNVLNRWAAKLHWRTAPKKERQ